MKGKTDEVQKQLEELEERRTAPGCDHTSVQGVHMCERHSDTCEWDERAR